MKTSLKVSIALLFITFNFQNLYPQIGIGTTSPHSSAILDVESETKGFLLPRMDTEKRDQINNEVYATGLMIYNTDENCLNVYNGSDWISLCGGNSSSPSGLPDNISALPRGSANLNTKFCFDIAEGNDLNEGCGYLDSRKALRSNFNDIATNTQTLSFTSQTPVSNLTFYSEDTTGLIIESFTTTEDYSASTNITTATATIVYKTNLSSPDPDNPTFSSVHGRSTFEALRSKYYAVYNNSPDGTGSEVKVTTGTQIKDCNCGGSNKRSALSHHFLSSDGTAYAMGVNTDAQPWIGNGSSSATYVDTLSRVDISNPIISITEGTFNSLYLDNIGEVYITAMTYDSLSPLNIGTGKPEKISMPNGQKVYDLASTQQRAFARTTDGTIYCWGNNINNQAQLGYSSNPTTLASGTPLPLLIPSGINVVDFDVALEANFLLTDNGKIYSAGAAYVNGRTSGGTSPFQEIIFPINAGKIIKIKTLVSTVIALDENGKLFSWGSNYYGQGMRAASGSGTSTPLEVTLPLTMGKPIEIYSGINKVYVLDDNNVLWASGYNRNGDLGVGIPGANKDRGVLTKCNIPPGVIPIDVIPKSYATLILGNDGKYYSAGEGLPSSDPTHTYSRIYRANDDSSKPRHQFHLVEHPDLFERTFIPY